MNGMTEALGRFVSTVLWLLDQVGVMQYMLLYLDHSKKAKTSINHWTTTVTSPRNQFYEFPACWDLRCRSFHSTFVRVAHCTPAFAIVGNFQI